jgi:VanZ family protein
MEMSPEEPGRASICTRMIYFFRERPRYFRTVGIIVLCMVVLFSIIPGDMQIRTPAPKTFEHFLAYFITASMLVLGYRRLPSAMAAGMFLITAAGALEMVQMVVPGRTASLLDWEASSLGTILGIVFALVLGNLLNNFLTATKQRMS